MIKTINRGAWVAQWVKAPAFGSGHDPSILGSNLTWALCSAGSLLPFLSLPALCLLVISVCQINKKYLKKKEKTKKES